MATAALGSNAAYACPACSAPVDEIGATCPGCGSTLGVDRCVVAVWRGYTTASFVARTGDEVVAESASFRCRGRQGPSESEAARAALSALTSELAESGWSAAPDDGGPAWFELAFDRLAARAPALDEEPEPAEREWFEEPAPAARPEPRTVVRRLPAPLPEMIEAPPAPEPKPAAEKPRRARGGRIVTVISIAGIAIAGILGYVIAHRAPQTVTKTTIVTVTQPAAKKTLTTAPPARHVTAAPPVAAPAPRVRVNLTATQETWLEARRGSKTGPVLFSGNLAEGQSLHFTGKRVFVRFAAAGNVHIVANGKLVPLMGTYDKLFVPSLG